MSTDIVTGSPAVVGFTHGHGHHVNPGISDKDQQFAAVIDAGERTRDVLNVQRTEGQWVQKSIYDGVLATEKIGAAAQLAAEKIGAANMLAIEKIGTASVLATSESRAALATQLAACCCELRREIADVKAEVLAVEARHVRDDLAQLRQETLFAKLGGVVNG